MIAELILTFIVAIAAYLYFLAKSRYRFFEEKGLKNVPVVPLFGNIMENTLKRKHMIYVYHDIYKALPNERVIGLFEFFNPVYMLRDPDLIKQITVKDFDHFVDHRSFFSQEADQIITNNLFSLKGDKWRDMRSTLSPAFTGSKMRNMCPFMVECGLQVVAYLKSESAKQSSGSSLEVEMKDLFTRFSVDVIANSAFGCKTDSLQDRTNEFYVAGKRLSTFTGWQILKSQIITTMPKIATALKLSLLNKEVTKFFENIYMSTIKYRQENNVVRPDMINMLMEVKKESLRLWPPAPFMDRLCVKTYNVPDKDGKKSDLVIEKGEVCLVPGRALHYDPLYWDEPEKFNPERFSAENKHKIKPFTYVPFGSGPRNCIGSRFALMELKVMLFYLIRNFVLTSCPKTMNPIVLPKDTFTMILKDGFWIKVTPRDIK